MSDHQLSVMQSQLTEILERIEAIEAQQERDHNLLLVAAKEIHALYLNRD